MSNNEKEISGLPVDESENAENKQELNDEQLDDVAGGAKKPLLLPKPDTSWFY